MLAGMWHEEARQMAILDVEVQAAEELAVEEFFPVL